MSFYFVNLRLQYIKFTRINNPCQYKWTNFFSEFCNHFFTFHKIAPIHQRMNIASPKLKNLYRSSTATLYAAMVLS